MVGLQIAVEIVFEVLVDDVLVVYSVFRKLDWHRLRAAGLDFAGEGLLRIVADNADALSPEEAGIELFAHGLRCIRYGCVVENGCVLDAFRHGSHGVHGGGQGHHACGGNGIFRGLEADYRMDRRRRDDGACGFRPDCCCGEVGGNGRAASGAGSFRRKVEGIEGIVGLAGLGAVAARHLRVHEVCEFGQVRFAQYDRTAVRQGRYYVSVVFWREVLERVGAVAGGHGVRVDVVFDEDGDSPHPRRSCGARVEGAGFLYRLRIDRRYCVDALFTGIVCFDAIQVERRQFFVGQVAPGDRRVQVLDGLLHDQVFFRTDFFEVYPGKLRVDERNLLVFVVGDALFLFGRERSWKR